MNGTGGGCSAFIPEFEPIVAMIRSFSTMYNHSYTVDEHNESNSSPTLPLIEKGELGKDKDFARRLVDPQAMV